MGIHPDTRSARQTVSSHACLAMFAVVFIAYLAIRAGLPHYIFDDTRHIYAGHVGSAGVPHDTTAGEVLEVLKSEFANGTSREYRPLSFAQHRLIISRYSPDPAERPWIPIFIVAFGWALTAALHCALALRLTGSAAAAVLATALYITAMPVLTGAWIVVMGWQWIVTSTILAGLLCYLEYKQRPKMRWLVLMLALALVGSWFREFSGLFVFIVLAHELIFEQRRSPALLAVLAVAALHVVFPAFLPSLFFPGELRAIALKPVYKLGPVGALSAGGSRLFDVTTLRPDALYHFLIQFAPLLWLLASAGAVAARCRLAPRYLVCRSWSTATARVLEYPVVRRSACIVLVVSGAVAAVGLVQANYAPTFVAACFVFFLMITMTALPAAPLLTIYALLSLLPFLKIYLHEVHLAYAVAPASILLAWLVLSLWRAVVAARRASHVQKPFQVAFFGVLAVIALDAALNVVGNTRAVKAVYEGVATRAAWLREHVARGAIVVGNFIDLRDTLLYAPGHFEPYFTITPHWEANHVNEPAALLDLIARESGKTPVYLLGAVFPRAADKYNYHHLHYLSIFSPAASEVRRFTTRAVYPYADPFKRFLPDTLTPYPGPPDLVDDYRVGKERDSARMMREFFADYLLVRIDGVSAQQKERLSSGLRGGAALGQYRGFNLFNAPAEGIVIGPSGQPIVPSPVMAIDQEFGAIAIMDGRRSKRYRECAANAKCFIADGVESAKAAIDAKRGRRPRRTPKRRGRAARPSRDDEIRVCD